MIQQATVGVKKTRAEGPGCRAGNPALVFRRGKDYTFFMAAKTGTATLPLRYGRAPRLLLTGRRRDTEKKIRKKRTFHFLCVLSALCGRKVSPVVETPGSGI